MTFLGLPMERSTLASAIDASVNFVTPVRAPMEALEARYVRRRKDYIVVYVSPQTACAQACRFCHLTASGQVKGRDATLAELEEQAKTVLAHFRQQVEAGREENSRVVHYNFMARGEALASKTILSEGPEVMEMLYRLAKENKLTPAVKISTIGPANVGSLLDIFPYEQPDYYYSIYSMDSSFRKKWLPNAGDPKRFLERLKEWQDITHKIPTLHHAVIEGENSSMETVADIIAVVDAVGLAVNVNLVRYNPPTERHGREASMSTLEAHVQAYREAWPNMRAKIVSKVGNDVAASCGMFVGGRAPK